MESRLAKLTPDFLKPVLRPMYRGYLSVSYRAKRFLRLVVHGYGWADPIAFSDNWGEIDLRVDCLNKVLNESVPVDETEYYQFAGDQDKGLVENPRSAVERLVNLHRDYPPKRAFPGRCILVERPDKGRRYHVVAGQDALAVAIYQGRKSVRFEILESRNDGRYPDYTEIIERKRGFYTKCCHDAPLRELLSEIRQLNYGALYCEDTSLARVVLSADGAVTKSKLQNFHDGARVVTRERNFYQGLESIGIIGERPSEVRFREYGLSHFLNGSETVLDLGCNVGFFSMYLSNHVSSVRGIEANKDLVAIANKVKEYLGIVNCEFAVESFEDINRSQKFDLILDCNFHYYLPIPPGQFLDIVCQMLKPGGKLLVEMATKATPRDRCEKLADCENLAIPEIDERVRSGRLRLLRQGLVTSNIQRIRKYSLLEVTS